MKKNREFGSHSAKYNATCNTDADIQLKSQRDTMALELWTKKTDHQQQVYLDHDTHDMMPMFHLNTM